MPRSFCVIIACSVCLARYGSVLQQCLVRVLHVKAIFARFPSTLLKIVLHEMFKHVKYLRIFLVRIRILLAATS